MFSQVNKSPVKEDHASLVYTLPKSFKLFSCSTQLSVKFILLINVKLLKIDGILTFLSRINDWLW